MSKILFLDCETYDPNIKKYGAGWVFKYHYGEYDFKVLGIGVLDSEGREMYLDMECNGAKSSLRALLGRHDTIVCHNSLYDIGCLKELFKEEFDFNSIIWIDTLIMAKLYDQHIFEKYKAANPYSLDTLGKIFKLEDKKNTGSLTDYVWNTGLYIQNHFAITGINKKTRPSEKILKDFCFKDLRVMPTDVISKYCIQDVRTTKQLYNVLSDKLTWDKEFYSNLLLACLECKKNGVRIDINKTKELFSRFELIENEAKNEIINYIENSLGNEFSTVNIDSTKQLSMVLEKLNYELPKTDKGNSSVKKEWLEKQDENNPFFKNLLRYRKAKKMKKDFLGKSIKYQDAIPKENRDSNYGWLYPSIKPLGAHHTGRFTSGGGAGCLELSIHQIPRRDEEFGKPLREIFVAHENEQLICGDFNGQESRIQVHYAEKLNCRGTKNIIKEWNNNPGMKFHDMVVNYTGLEYDIAKMINLALSYGMGEKALCHRIGLGAIESAALLKKYYTMLPFMKELQNITTDSMKRNKYIKTIANRKLNIDVPYVFNGRSITFEHKALSKLIQGSAADQCMKAMVDIYKSGKKILFSVHDEIVISSGSPDKDLVILKDKMEKAIPLIVPVIADVNKGFSWGEAK